MNKLTTLLLSAALLATSCSKSGDSNTDKPSSTQPTVLLTKITNVTPGVDNGKVIAEFLYNGKQLIKANLDKQANGTFAEAHTFNYNSQSQLTGTTISSGQYGYRKADVTYNGSNIATVAFTRYDNTVRGNTLTYQNGRLATWRMDTGFSPQIGIEYTYDANGHNSKRVETEYYTTPRTYAFNYNSFDNKSNLASSLPYWIYFRTYQVSGIGDVLGTNNPLTGNEDGFTANFIYTYNSDGYPSKVTSIVGTREHSYTYEYATAN
ncbi:hypothetical protein LLH06_16695 [Mucilaginibacter daejeonensis]|uniref:hypothetical protein n=1 Tax=Mucilaginibacter daejeonensis TaxID=398049 RepID=UPI001D175489|nr:hypothetical protein [Mucilaginibacter daejeonensis]UEG52595.1 hypothetical protein LLH06_16695 [Mucilaginibacter daejeonensis]